jgi:hypothetical protein
MDVFSCQHCSAFPELLVDGRAQLSVVRHSLGCTTLLAQVRARWPLSTTLPDTPAQVPFEQRAAYGRWHRTVRAREERRAATNGTHAGNFFTDLDESIIRK